MYLNSLTSISAAARFQGAAEVAARAELTRLLCPLLRPPPPSLPASLPASPHGGGRDSSSTQDGESSATAAAPAGASRQEERGRGSSPKRKGRAVLSHQRASTDASTEGKLKGKYGSSQKGKEGCFFHS